MIIIFLFILYNSLKITFLFTSDIKDIFHHQFIYIDTKSYLRMNTIKYFYKCIMKKYLFIILVWICQNALKYIISS